MRCRGRSTAVVSSCKHGELGVLPISAQHGCVRFFGLKSTTLGRNLILALRSRDVDQSGSSIFEDVEGQTSKDLFFHFRRCFS